MIDVLALSAIAGSAGCGCAVGWILAGRREHGGEQPADLRCAYPDVQNIKRALEEMRRRPRRVESNAAARLLVDVVREIADSPRERDAEAGRLLLDYYIKRVGSHEVVMQRLYLSRATFYRRLKYGLALVAERLADYAADSGPEAARPAPWNAGFRHAPSKLPPHGGGILSPWASA